MPIVDGISATKMIREYEGTIATAASPATTNADEDCNNHIPIFAVSASLLEKDRQTYIDSGFDGWILKPIDFKRVDHLLGGVHEDNFRDDSIYTAGMWEKGGWFSKRDKL